MVENLVNAVCKLAGIPVPEKKATLSFLWDKMDEIRVEVEPDHGFIRIFATSGEVDMEDPLNKMRAVLAPHEFCVKVALNDKQEVQGEVWGLKMKASTMRKFAEMSLRLGPTSSALILFALAGVPGWEERLTYRAAA